jgi:hypothetical protein
MDPTMMMRIDMMQALNRHVERVLNTSRKDTHRGRRKLKREMRQRYRRARPQNKITKSPQFRNAMSDFVERLAAEF